MAQAIALGASGQIYVADDSDAISGDPLRAFSRALTTPLLSRSTMEARHATSHLSNGRPATAISTVLLMAWLSQAATGAPFERGRSGHRRIRHAVVASYLALAASSAAEVPPPKQVSQAVACFGRIDVSEHVNARVPYSQTLFVHQLAAQGAPPTGIYCPRRTGTETHWLVAPVLHFYEPDHPLSIGLHGDTGAFFLTWSQVESVAGNGKVGPLTQAVLRPTAQQGCAFAHRCTGTVEAVTKDDVRQVHALPDSDKRLRFQIIPQVESLGDTFELTIAPLDAQL